jgi:hypothetical protein
MVVDTSNLYLDRNKEGNTMTESDKDEGVITALLERLEKQRLPRAIGLKERVDNGEKLTEYDIEFLKSVFNDANNIKPLLDRHPEYQDLTEQLIHLYHDITEQALKNEQSG